jgi:hypothetical protein
MKRFFSLFSDDWIRELDHQQPPYPASNKSSLVPLDFNELPPVRATTRVRYNELPPDVQGRLLADINQELIDFEIKNAMAELSGQSLTHRVRLSVTSLRTMTGRSFPPSRKSFQLYSNKTHLSYPR